MLAANILETHPVVDGESGDLECHRDHVDGAVQQGRLKLLLQVDLLRSGQEQKELALEQKKKRYDGYISTEISVDSIIVSTVEIFENLDA